MAGCILEDALLYCTVLYCTDSRTQPLSDKPSSALLNTSTPWNGTIYLPGNISHKQNKKIEQAPMEKKNHPPSPYNSPQTKSQGQSIPITHPPSHHHQQRNITACSFIPINDVSLSAL